MENDQRKNEQNKNESKGKRILKKTIRRNSKSSNNSQSSALGSVGVSRSKSYENKVQSIEINDTAPLPKPDGAKETVDLAGKSKDDKSTGQKRIVPNVGSKIIKSVDIQENRNEIFLASPAPSNKNSKLLSSQKLVIKDQDVADADAAKRNLKRKLEESGAGTSTGTSDTDADEKDPTKVKKKKNRCAVCGKKVGLTGFQCRCGGLFCAVHRYSDKHDCTFDYKELGAQEIRRNNPVVISQKIDKI